MTLQIIINQNISRLMCSYVLKEEKAELEKKSCQYFISLNLVHSNDQTCDLEASSQIDQANNLSNNSLEVNKYLIIAWQTKIN
jgi:hypothetical protein